MPKRTLIIVAAAVAVALGVWFFFFRRRVQAEVYGDNVSMPPSTQGALAQLQQSVSGYLGQRVEGVTYRALDTIGTAVVPHLPQSTARPVEQAAAVTSYFSSLPVVGNYFKPVAQQTLAAASMNYNASAGYYG